MEKLSIEEIKKIELDILKYIDKICKENSISYFLDAGTLLGAIRHKGFIPWDDDIDIAMLRSEYEKLKKIINNNNKRYKLLSYETCKDYYYPFSKLVDTSTIAIEEKFRRISELGVWVDIFPLDKIPNKEQVIKKSILRTDRIRTIISYKKRKHAPYKSTNGIFRYIKSMIYYFIFNIIPIKQILSWWEIKSKQYENLKEQYVWINLLGHRIMRPDTVEKTAICEFEGNYFFVPLDFDSYLKECYGDYMSLPPEEKRIPEHCIIAYKRL